MKLLAKSLYWWTSFWRSEVKIILPLSLPLPPPSLPPSLSLSLLPLSPSSPSSFPLPLLNLLPLLQPTPPPSSLSPSLPLSNLLSLLQPTPLPLLPPAHLGHVQKEHQSCLHHSRVLVTQGSSEVVLKMCHRRWRKQVEMMHGHDGFLTHQLSET